MKSEILTRSLHSRGALTLSVLVTAVCALVAFFTSGEPLPMSAEGFVSKWSGDWSLLPFWASVSIEVVLIGLILSLTAYINKRYNLMRATSMLPGTLFLFICCATPQLLLEFCPGTVLCLVVMWSVATLYSVSAAEEYDTKRIFMVFVVVSACVSSDWTYVLYMPILLLACMQLRIFSLRTLSAIAMGIVTPWIILVGLGIVDVSQLQMPSWHFNLPSLSDTRAISLLFTMVLTVCITTIALLQNMVKTISYNARSRSLLSVVTTTTILTLVSAVIDFDDMYSYVTLLNMCAAFQLSHMFVAIHNFPRSYIAILSIAGVYLAIFVWGCFI